MNFFIYTFGCRLNQAESQELAQALTKKGLALGPDISSADLVIVNTCVVTTKAEKVDFANNSQFILLDEDLPTFSILRRIGNKKI